MKKNPLLGALPILAAMLGQKLGVQVVIGGSRACTDGQTICLPALPPDADASLAVLANGYIDHEAAHIRYTDFAAGKPAGLTGHIADILEDTRIERLLGERFPGCRHNLAELVAVLEAEETLVPAPDAPIQAQVSMALVTLLRARLLGQTALSAPAAILEARLDGLLPPGVVTKLLALAFAVEDTTSTAEVIALARRIVAMLEEEAADPPDPPDLQGSSGASAGTTPDPQGSSGPDTGTTPDPQGSSEPDTGTTPDPQGSSGPDTGTTPDSQGSSGTNTGTVPSPQGSPSSDPRRAQLASLLDATDDAGDYGGDLGQRAAALLNGQAQAHRADAVAMAGMEDFPSNHDPQTAAAKARAATAALRQRLGALVQAAHTEATWRTHRGRQLETRDLYRPAVGQSIRFLHQEVREAPDTAIALLLDRSISMRLTIRLATQAILAITLALDTVPGVVCWAAAFPGGEQRESLIPLKTFEERAGRIAGRFRLTANGGTPLAGALWRAGYELIQRPQSRRLVLVVTDGKPGNAAGVQRILQRCRASGIEVIGLGIGQALADVQEVFGRRDATAITTISELAPKLFAVLAQRLTAVAA